MAAPAPVGGDPRIHTDLHHLGGLEARARGFDFMPRQPVGSVLAGRRASRLRGRGLEFEEIRAYLPGDDTRSMDWRVTARTGSPHVRVTREERDRPALIIIDQRQSMFFGSRLNMKSVTAAEVAALAAWRILAAGDRVGGLVLSDTAIEDQRPARSRNAVLRLLSLIATRNAALSAEAPVVADAPGILDHALEQAARVVTHDWLVIILSDFDGAGDGTFRALSRLARNNDLVLGLIYDPLAHEVPAAGRLVIGDGHLQVELDFAEKKVQRNLAETGGERLRGLLAWQERLDAAILPVSAGEATLPQILRLFGSGRPARVADFGGGGP
ncbi:MAG TPA: DUF58 domain-containing protein [Paracoccus sp. (in: a-proteobacteria)]|uniref:DUF58 domain-containing protein n=1 Tax=Paracoccus sp. TaxID=267 RepID=UPI002BFFC077|nr:DUF58 domain-containing protein [Paracoccus sp. (in: a-proteobacteria)]HWL56286.1 DUF58 domain-containing protein [Paracoccus sp. (in: a-proteobacteria)]